LFWFWNLGLVTHRTWSWWTKDWGSWWKVKSDIFITVYSLNCLFLQHGYEAFFLCLCICFALHCRQSCILKITHRTLFCTTFSFTHFYELPNQMIMAFACNYNKRVPFLSLCQNNAPFSPLFYKHNFLSFYNYINHLSNNL